MAVHFTFAASTAHKSIPCAEDSISLVELKDAIAAPLVAALKGKELREQFDLRVFDAVSKEEIVGASTQVRKNASVLVKRVPAYVIAQRNQRPAAVSSRGSEVNSAFAQSVILASDNQRPAAAVTSRLKMDSAWAQSVIDDDFGEDVYSGSFSSVVSREEVENVGKESSESKIIGKVKVSDTDSGERAYSSSDASALTTVEAERVPKESKILSRKENRAFNEIVVDVPEEFTCNLCKSIMKDPMLIPCCCKSFCGSCIKFALVERGKCPNCDASKYRDEDLLLNRHLKSMIDVYYKSNPSLSSCGSCPSESSLSQVQSDEPRKILPQNVANQAIRDSTMVPSALLGKRKPLVISLNNGKHTKVVSTATSASLGERKPLVNSLNIAKRAKVV